MKVNQTLISEYFNEFSNSIYLNAKTFDTSNLPRFDLMEAIPDYSSQEGFTLEARLSFSGGGKQSALYCNSDEAKKNLIYAMVISREWYSEAHFTKRDGWKCYQLIYTNSGCGILNFENNVYTLKPGSLFLLDCRKYHYFYTAGPEGWDYSFIHFFGGTSEYLFEKIAKNSLYFENAVSTRAVKKFNTIFELSKFDSPDFEIKFHELITSLLSDLVFLKIDREPAVKVPVWLGDVLEYISDNYDRQIRVETLAEMAYLSPGRFAHRFKEFVGQSPIEYQYSIRMAYAKQFLETTDMTPEEICERIGFGNIANFYTRFKKSEGMPPVKYRKKQKEQPVIRT